MFWPRLCYFPDFTKESTRKWWGNSFKNTYVNNRFKSFWNDIHEPEGCEKEFPNVIEFGEGRDKKTLYTVKNACVTLIVKATFEGTKALMNEQRSFC